MDPLCPAASRRRGRLRAASLLLAISSLASFARADDQQGWMALSVNGPLAADSRLLGWFDAHARWRDEAGTLDTTILRPGLGWRVGPKLDLWVGYAWIDNRRAGPDLEERRFWQQASYPLGAWAGGRLNGRTRLEQRTRDTGSDTGWRLRQFVRYARPVAAAPGFGLLASTEVFVALGDADWGQRSGFDQNRALLGAYYQPGKRWRLEGGYMHQYIRVPGARPDRINHNLAVTLVGLL